MSKFLLLFSVCSLVFVADCLPQCNPMIPYNAKVISYTQMAGGGGGNYWVCSGDSLDSGGGGQSIYLEPGAWSIGGGGSQTIWCPPGAYVNRSGSGSNKIYYVCPESLIGPGGGPILIQCPAIHYDYSVAPFPGCQPLSSTAVCPSKPVFTASDTAFCDETGKCVSFTDHSTGNPTSWKWSFPGASPDTSTQQNPTNICYYYPGTYAVTEIVTTNGLPDTITVSPMITMGTPPSVPVITVVGGDTLISSPGATYQWFLNGSPIGGAIDSFYIATQPGTYSVRITNSLGCGSLSGGTLITTTNEFFHSLAVKVYPNPAHDELIISGDIGSCLLIISNALGEKLLEENIQAGNSYVAIIKNFSAGVYFVCLRKEQGFGVAKFIKQ